MLVTQKKAAITTIAVLDRRAGSEIEYRLSNYIAFGKVLVPLEDTIIVGGCYYMRRCNPSDYTYQVDDGEQVLYSPAIGLK